jgi:ABC-type uncharacterized transport system auxiliary subunit
MNTPTAPGVTLRDRLTRKRLPRSLGGESRSDKVFGGLTMLRLAVVAIMLFVATLSGCSKTTLSTDAYHLVGALDRIFEKRDPQQLKLASDKINEELAAGKITDDEAKTLNALVAKAQNDDWQSASSEARKLLSDQTEW